MYHSFTAEELQEIAEELELEHDDYDRLATFVNIVFYYDHNAEKPETAIRERLAKHISDEHDSFWGDWADEREFVQFYLNETGATVPDWLVIDWDETWNRQLRHSFTFEDGHVWSDIW